MTLAARSVLLVLVSHAVGSPCDEDCAPAEVRSAVGNVTSVEEFTGCAGAEELCICSLLRLGWTVQARELLHARMTRKEPAPLLRRFAQSRHDGAVALLARLHPKYPQHLKMIPAPEWAQSADAIFVRIRFARYTRGEPLVLGADMVDVRWDDAALWVSAEGDEKPLYIETSLRWRQLLRRYDGCADGEEGCRRWADEGACTEDEALAAAPLERRCADHDERCQAWAKDGDCESNPGLMHESCRASC